MITPEELVERAEAYARAEMGDDPSGHDSWHAVWVRNAAVAIARAEGADTFLVEVTALLHASPTRGSLARPRPAPRQRAPSFAPRGCEEPFVEHVASIIAPMSFKGAGVADCPMSLEGQCVRDTDRLDAIGAIGIAGTFAFGGKADRPIHNPDEAPVLHADAAAYRAKTSSTINHFPEKLLLLLLLLLLRDGMTTTAGRAIAEERHAYMAGFLARFGAEWSGEA